MGYLERKECTYLNVDNDKITTQWSFICKPLILRMSIEGGDKREVSRCNVCSQKENCFYLDDLRN